MVSVWCAPRISPWSLLFLILMLDITKGLTHSALTSFADDTKIWKGITNATNENQLQEDLDMVYLWAAENNMEFNSKKFQAIRFAELFGHSQYTNDKKQPIDHFKLIKDLGIHISFDMEFDQHTCIVVNKGKQLAGWILRIFNTRCPTVMLTLLKQLIYPTLEYNSVLWSPKKRDLIDNLETVQKNFIKKINCPELVNSDYWDRLSHFKLYSMERRRERYAIMYVWKVLHGLYPNPGIQMNTTAADHKINPNKGISIDAHPRLGMTAHHTTNNDIPQWLRSKGVLKTCCDLFNSIPCAPRQPSTDDEEPAFPKFKKALDEWLVKVPDRPACTGRINPARSNSILHQKEYIQRD